MNKLRYLLLVGALLALPFTACTNPASTNPLDADAGSDMVVAPEESVVLTATATGGTAPYIFRWSIQRQPDTADIDLTGHEVGASVTVGELAVVGDYQFRVRVTDAAGQTDMSYINVAVGGDLDVTATARDVLRTVGESTPISVTIDSNTSGLTNKRIHWEVVSGDATIASTAAASTQATINAEQTTKLRVTVTADNGDTEVTGLAVLNIVGVRDATPQVVIENTGGVSGQMVIELFGNEAPNTVANFLRYVDSGYYDGIVWHRVDGNFVIQTGAYERSGDRLVKRFGARPPIENEANNGRTNIRGSVGLALVGDDADSGDSQFYVNLVDNLELDSSTPPYTVFGRVVDGLTEVVDEIADVAVGADSSGLEDVPLEDIIMQSVYRIDEEIPTDSDTSGPLIEIDVTAEADDAIRIVGDSTTVRTIVPDAPQGLNFTWSVVSGAATFGDNTDATTSVTIDAAITTQLRVTVRGEGVMPASADVYVVGVENATPRVVISNTGGVTGDIVLELLTEEAPNTCANFLRYVDDRFFDGVVWHRAKANFVIQGGAFEPVEGGLQEREGERDPVASEADNGESNLRGTVSMALRGNDADSGTNQFFVNLIDNTGLDTGIPPFTVFARVVEGMDVVDDIGTVGVHVDDLSGLADVPIENIIMSRVRRESESAGGIFASVASTDTNDLANRVFHTAAMLDKLDNPLALIAGGLNVSDPANLQSLSTVTFYDPQTGVFTDEYSTSSNGLVVPELNVARSGQMQLTLRRGEILILGGEVGASGTSRGTATTSVEFFDPDTGAFTERASMSVARGHDHAATRMPVARTIVCGGSTWEIYTPGEDTWAGPFDMAHSRLGHTAITVVDLFDNSLDPFINPVHRALVIGGEGDGPRTFETLDPDTELAEALSATLPIGLRDTAAVNLIVADNIVLIAGGIDVDTGNSVSDAYLLDVQNDTIKTVDPLPNLSGGIAGHKMFLLSDRYAVVVDGYTVRNGVATAVDYYAVFDRETESWIESGLMRFPRAHFAATALDERSILVTGGGSADDPPMDVRNDAEVITLDIDTNG
ncbi:MAG: peptidylprolyl isomerase [Phycisphaerales bacterium]|nr:peptidylprolyl isomerase [Phycisphaerales bacterium]